MAVVNMVKVRKTKSPILITIRNIGAADALVSMLTLQAAMFASFQDKNSLNTNQINGAVTAGCGLSFPAEPPRNIQDFRVFLAQINNSINVNAGSAEGSVLLSI